MEEVDQQPQPNQKTLIDQNTNTTASQNLSVNKKERKKERKKKLLKIFFCVATAVVAIIFIGSIFWNFLEVYILFKSKKEFAEVTEMNWEISSNLLKGKNEKLKELIPKFQEVILSLSPNENLGYLEKYLSKEFTPKKTPEMSWYDYGMQLEAKNKELKKQIYLLQEKYTALLPKENYQGWESYTNNNFGFGFKYPHDDQFISEVKDNYSDQTIITVKDRAGNQVCYMEISYMDSSRYHPPRGTDIIDYAAFDAPTYDEWAPSFNIANLRTVHKIEYNETSEIDPRTDYYQFIKGKQAFLVQFFSPNKEEELPMGKKILRSFKFNEEIAELSEERIFKPIEFSIENGLQMRKANLLKFTAQIPSTASLSHSKTEEDNSVIIQDNNFRLEVAKAHGSISMGMSEYKRIFEHPQFKEVYRITSARTTNHYYYSNYLLSENEKCNIKAEGIDTACAIDVIRVDDRYAFYLFCDADKDNIQVCDDIVESLQVKEK